MSRQITIGIVVGLLAWGGSPASAGAARSMMGQDSCPGEGLPTTASDGELENWFGAAVSMHGNTALIGASAHDEVIRDEGAAYIFERDGPAWRETAKLTAPDPLEEDKFGWSVSISGTTAVVGTPLADFVARDDGAVYIFDKIEGTWAFTTKLTAPDGARSGDNYGWAVSLDGDTLAVGVPGDDDDGESSGSVYVYKRLNGQWFLLQKLTAPDASAGDRFGFALCLRGDRLIIGAPDASPFDEYQIGRAYLYERVGNTWQFKSFLPNVSGNDGDRFGLRVAIEGRWAFVGAPGDDRAGEGDVGSVQVFRRDSQGRWEAFERLVASDPRRASWFGAAIAIEGGNAVVGAPFNRNNGELWGAAYTFRLINGSWTETGRLAAGNGDGHQDFGLSVALSGERFVVGAPSAFQPDLEGAAYFMHIEPDPCCPDLNRDGILDADDFFLFLDLFAAEDPHADFVEDGKIDSADFFRYTDLFARDCP